MQDGRLNITLSKLKNRDVLIRPHRMGIIGSQKDRSYNMRKKHEGTSIGREVFNGGEKPERPIK